MSAPLLPADEDGLRRAVELLREGQVIAFPTDTVYGLAARHADSAARERIYAVKSRPADKALIAMAPTLEGFADLVEVSGPVRRVTERWWPGPLTLVLPSSAEEGTTLGVRVPAHPVALALLRRMGEVLATTSANRSGAPAARTAEEAARLDGVAAVVDGGPAPGGQASTVLTLATLDPEVLREGPIGRRALLLPLLADKFRIFGGIEAARDSPLYAAVATGLADRPDVLELLLGAQVGQRRPNLLLAALHLLLLEGADDPLRGWYPDLGGTRPPGPEVADAFAAMALRHGDRVRTIVSTHRTQTNEVARSAALVLGLARVRGPVALLDAGCSAGLNLYLDRFSYDFGIGRLGPADAPLTLRIPLRGAAAAVPASLPDVVWRAGLDASPLDPRDPATVRWLLALVWPEHGQRRERLEAALRVAALDPAPLYRGDLLHDLEAVARRAPAGAALVVQHSAVTTYLAPADRDRLARLIHSLGAHDLALEGSRQGPWTDNVLSLDGLPLARADGHNGAIEWIA